MLKNICTHFLFTRGAGYNSLSRRVSFKGVNPGNPGDRFTLPGFK